MTRMNPQLQFMLQRALQAFEGKDFDSVDIILKKVLQVDSKNFPALHIMGLIKISQLNYSEATDYLARAARIHPNDASIQHNLAKALTESGRDIDAIAHHKKAVALNSNNSEAWLSYGKTAFNLGRYDEAFTHYDKAISIKPDYAEAWSNKGVTSQALKLHDEAIAHYDKAISIKPDYAVAWSNKGLTLHELMRYDEAFTHYDKAISIKSDFVEAFSNKGVTLHALKRYDEAIAHYDKAISIKPDYAEAWSNKGLTLHELMRYDEAFTHYDKAISIKPDYAEAWSNKGVTSQALKLHDEAIAHYDKAISIKPDYAEAWSNKALLNLFLKNYQAGWENYDWRLREEKSQLKMPLEHLAIWNGSNCKHLLLISEQGVGDIIFYASMLEIVKNRVQSITISTDARLLPILSRSFPEIVFVENIAPLDISLYDAQTFFGSLSVVLNMHPDMIGRRAPYLIDNDVITRSLKNISSLNKQIKCGVAWKSKNQKLGKSKSILLSDLNDIFQVDGCEFINLQYGDTQEEIKHLENNYGSKLKTIDGIDLFNNIDGLLSIIQTCDVIVTTSNITAHLAGALGKTTFLLVPYSVGRIWYWHEEAISSWYPSISLYSQDQNFEWNGAIRDIASRLKNEIFK
jgi:tetratricopeptide (TPR) repeat protein